jgi:hypothetical protein
MKGFAPRWLLSAHGQLADQDPHARDGYHLRVMPSALLGLPIVPLVVYRTAIDAPAWRDDIVWLDDQGRVLTAPFDVSPGHPVHGHLPPPSDGVCGWFSIEARVDFGPVFGLGGVARPARRRTRSAMAARRAAVATTDPVPALPGLKLEAQVMTPRGWASVAARSAAPWVVSATPIERVVVSGTGTVNSARWIDVRPLDPGDEPLALLALPIARGRRYRASADDAYAYARAQATRVAATRRALHEVPWASGPGAAPPWTAEQEGERIDALCDELVADLQALADDTRRQIDVRAEAPIEQNGAALPAGGTLSRPLLAGVLAAAQDAAVARFLGLSSWDDAPPFGKEGALPDNGLAYHVLGYWEVEEREGEHGVVQPLRPAEQLAQGRDDIFWPLPWDTKVFTRAPKLRDELKQRGLKPPRGELGPVALLHTTLVVLSTDPMPDAPSPPLIDSLAAAEPAWRPGTAPEARRRTAIALSGLVPGSGLALARRSDAVPVWRPLNPAVRSWRSLIVPGAPASATAPGHAELGDRDAPPLAASYRLAQCDSFGRWSAWAAGELADGVRPPPPRPVIEALFTPAQPADPPADAALAGSIRVSVAVPTPNNLPPGAHLLDHVRILFDGTEVASAAPASEPTLVIPLPGPLLTPTARRSVAVSAIWFDTAGQSSRESLTVTLNCYDLRAPPQVLLPPGLHYASRPDATGRSRAEIAWKVQPGQARFRVYVAHETTLLSKLDELGQQARLDQLAAQAAPERAATLRSADVRTLFPRELFALLTDAPVVATGHTARFEHALSASLAGLSFYRIVALAETNTEATFEDAELLPVAVPNSPAPARPTLELAAIDVPLADGRRVPGIRVRLTVPAGLRPAVAYRLFRSTEETRDVNRMPLLAAGALPAPAGPGLPQGYTLLLVGDPAPGTPDPALVGPCDELLPADIRLWMRYHLRADVRGADEPGSGLDGTLAMPGDWSAAALPVSVLVLASEPPPAVSELDWLDSRMQLRWKHPGELLGRHAGRYLFDVYRTRPDERETLFASVAGDATRDQGGRPAGRGGFFHVTDPEATARTRYRVVLSDPLGRPSPVAELTVPRTR